MMHRSGRPRTRGFTLVEVLIVVAILAILAAVGYPAYRDQVMRSRRAEAKAMLLDAQSRQERYLITNGQYTKTLTDLGYAKAAPKSENGFYTLSTAYRGGSSVSYLLKASPTGFTDAKCGNLTVDERGNKDVDGATLSADLCWGR